MLKKYPRSYTPIFSLSYCLEVEAAPMPPVDRAWELNLLKKVWQNCYEGYSLLDKARRLLEVIGA
jgi:hypothetical protein